MGCCELRMRLTDVFRTCDHFSIGPRGVSDQLCSRITRPISPAPVRNSKPADKGGERAGGPETECVCGELVLYRLTRLSIAASRSRAIFDLETKFRAPA